MSKAYKCDRCENYYDTYYADIKVNDNPIIENPTKYDLCEKCYEKLTKFLENKEEE